MGARAECNAQSAAAVERSVAYAAEVQFRLGLRQVRWMHLVRRWDCNIGVPYLLPAYRNVLSWKCTISGAYMIQQGSILPTRALSYLLKCRCFHRIELTNAFLCSASGAGQGSIDNRIEQAMVSLKF